MEALKETPIPKDMAKRILKGPHVIRRLQNEALNPEIPDADVVAKDIIRQEGYPLSDLQLEVFFTSAPRLVDHKLGRKLARDRRLKDPFGFKAEAAELYHFPPTLADVVIHPTSITFRLEQAAFRAKYEEQRREVQAPPPTKYPIGYTSYRDFLQLGEAQLPFSFSDADNGYNSTPQHEARHLHYAYLHPSIVPPQDQRFSYETYRRYLKESTGKALEQSDQNAFQTLVQDMLSGTLSSYLNERYVRSFEDKPDEPQHDTFSEFFDLDHNSDLKQDFDAIWQAFPKEVTDHLRWEKIAFDEFTKVRHKAFYIENRYQRLLTANHPLTSEIIAFLTPEQGYIINAYLLPTGELITIEKMKQWKAEYENYPEKEGVVDHWSAFLLQASQITEYDYLFDVVNRDRMENPLPHRPLNFDQVIQGTILEDSISVMATAVSRAKRLQTVLHHPLLNELTEEQKIQVRQQVIEISCDFHHLFYAYYQSFIKKLPFQLTADEIAEFTKRSIDLDHAAEELASLLFQNIEVDFDRLFLPGFRKSAEAVPVLPQRPEPRDWSGVVTDDPINETTLVDGGEVNHESIRSLEFVAD